MSNFQHADQGGDCVAGFRWPDDDGLGSIVTLSTFNPSAERFGPPVVLDVKAQAALAAFLTAGVDA